MKTIEFKSLRRRVNSERSLAVEDICYFIDRDIYRFGYWLGRSKHLKPSEIYDLISKSKSGRNPQALFQYLLGKSKINNNSHPTLE